MDSVAGIKRLNPQTNLPFKRGDRDERGFYFLKYTKIINKNNNFRETWLSPIGWVNNIKADRIASKKTRINKAAKAKKIKGKKRLNPETNKIFEKWFVDLSKNKFFYNYDISYIKNDGFYRERWYNLDNFHKCSLQSKLRDVKKRAIQRGLKFNLDLNYLLSILPKDMICPILKIPMNIGLNNQSTLSFDRINNNLGYIKGNVALISKKANSIKNTGTSQEILAVGNWLKEMEKQNG